MKYRWLLAISLLLPLIFVNNNTSVAAPVPDETIIDTYTYEAGKPPDELVTFPGFRRSRCL